MTTSSEPERNVRHPRVIGTDARRSIVRRRRDGLLVTSDPVEGDGMIVAPATAPRADDEQLVVPEP